MLKFIVVPLNLMFIFLLNALLSEDVTIKQDFPSGIPSLGECEVKVTIEKGKVSGFAKYEQSLPQGVEIEAVDLAGASYTQTPGSGKFIWMSLPADESFTFTFKVKVTDPYLDKIDMGGKFTYLDKNKKMIYDVTPRAIVVGGAPVIKKEEKEDTNPFATGSRSITSLGNDQYKMTVSINKSNVNGFAKIQDYIPSGASASEDATAGATFTVVDKKVKFVWMELPNGDDFDISYTLDLSNASNKDPKSVFGEFSFLQDNQSQKVEIGKGKISEEIAMVEEEVIPEPVKETPKKVKKTTPKKNATYTPTTVTSTPSVQNGINYRVQILAGHKNVGASYFNEMHQYTGQFYVENHEGWIKYTTGSHGRYGEARNARENFTSNYNFPGPFVVAYNDGNRITVQEALMITGQKWLK